MNPYGWSSSDSESEEEVEEEIDIEESKSKWKSHPNENLPDVREVMRETNLLWYVNYHQYVRLILKNSENENFKTWVTLAVKQVNKDLDLKDWKDEKLKTKLFLDFHDDDEYQKVISGYNFIDLLLKYKDETSPLEKLFEIYDVVDPFDYKDRLLVRYLVKYINYEKDGRNFAEVLQGDNDEEPTWRVAGDPTNRIMEFVGGKRNKDPFSRRKVDPKVSSSFQGKSVW